MTKPSELLDKIDFNYSWIELFSYSTLTQKLVFRIDLCNWRQQDFQQGDAEIVNGKLCFNRIGKILFEPDELKEKADQDISAEILDCKVIEEIKADHLEKVKIAMQVDGPSQANTTFGLIFVEAAEATWTLTKRIRMERGPFDKSQKVK